MTPDCPGRARTLGSHHGGEGSQLARDTSSGSGEVVPPLSLLALSPLRAQLVRTCPQPADCSKNRCRVCPRPCQAGPWPQARVDPGLWEFGGSHASHHPPAWGGIPVSTQLNSIPSIPHVSLEPHSHASPVPDTGDTCPQRIDLIPVSTGDPSLSPLGRREQSCPRGPVWRGAGSTEPRVQDEAGFASFLPQRILAPTSAMCRAGGCGRARAPGEEDDASDSDGSTATTSPPPAPASARKSPTGSFSVSLRAS